MLVLGGIRNLSTLYMIDQALRPLLWSYDGCYQSMAWPLRIRTTHAVLIINEPWPLTIAEPSLLSTPPRYL